MFRIGTGHDTHRLVAGRPLILGGVLIESDCGADGHSDGDALAHALADAILGALCEGDLGVHFPDSDSQWKDADSLQLLARVCWLARERGYHLVNADATIMLERPKLGEYIATIFDEIKARPIYLVADIRQASRTVNHTPPSLPADSADGASSVA